jgi:hypothetical protein
MKQVNIAVDWRQKALAFGQALVD